ncbi:MAG: hypothetical protein E7231_01970 [Cellulosilyticum sp.]|nr:hypothetical protein [Cellulosilyticum sp.]
MKRILLFIGSICLLLIGFLICFNPIAASTPVMQTLKGTTLIDRLTEDSFKIELFYSDLSLSQIESYEVTASHIEPCSTPYTSFTEGFISSDKHAILLDAVNKYRHFQGLTPITYYHNYMEIDNYGFLSLTEGLGTLYIINLSTYEITTPSFDSEYALESQYVYHIVEGADVYYILTAQANSYKAFWYALSKDTFELKASRKLSPPTKALQSNQYALDRNGSAYFIGSNSLLVITPEETINIPLTFDPDTVYYADGQIYTLSLSELFLNYAVYNEDVGLSQWGQVNLPNKFASLVSCTIKNNILYTVTYDENHPLYRNYLTLYSLENNNIIYCLALKSHSGLLALQNAHFH